MQALGASGARTSLARFAEPVAWLLLLSLLVVVALAGCGRRSGRATGGALPAKSASPARVADEVCDSDGWCVQNLAGADTFPKHLCGIWAASASDVWAVGNTVARWDGVRWGEVAGALPGELPKSGCTLKAIHGFGPNAVWAIGSARSLFWDGKQLSEHAMPSAFSDASAVHGSASDDVWAVAESGLTAHFDGHAWSAVETSSELSLTSVFCARKDDCWAAGGKPPELGESRLILHWNGSLWREEQLPAAATLRGLSGTASDDVWAVGQWGRVFHYDGRSWSRIQSHAKRTIFAVVATARDDVWATGEDGLVLHYDGKDWSAALPTWAWIQSLTSTPSRELWAIAGETMLHWRGGTYRPRPVPPARLWASDDRAEVAPEGTARNGAQPRVSVGSRIALSGADLQQEREFLAALGRGRKATSAKDYQAAADAYRRALEIRPFDARALGEQGFALLQSNDLNGAEFSFRMAEGRAPEPLVSAQIFYNQGLVAEKRGDLEGATLAFARSLATHKTSAAEKKTKQLAASTCTAAFLRLSDSLEHYENWRGLHSKLRGGKAPASDQEAMTDLEVSSCTPACAVGDNMSWHVVVPSAGGLDVLRNVDSGGFYRCGGPPSFEFELRGHYLRIISTNTELTTANFGPCDENVCMKSCADGPSHRYESFVDLTNKRALLRISQFAPLSDSFKPLPITFSEQEVKIAAGNCDRVWPLAGN
jgi:tetratricopeptide (TPR) repeat protein